MLWIITLTLLLHGILAEASEPATEPVSLADLATAADLVVVAQIRDTDYFTRRNIPVSGSAYLQVLISYKAPRGTGQAGSIIEVYEKGLRENECYFPNPGVFEEGRRYLLFLKRDPENEQRYRGLPQGCALDVLVDSDNLYALRYPVDGIDLSDSLVELARTMSFSDGYALVGDEELDPMKRDAMLGAGQITPHGSTGRQWIFTQGVSLADLRERMAPGGLFH